MASACVRTGIFQFLPKSCKIGHKKWQNTVFTLRFFPNNDMGVLSPGVSQSCFMAHPSLQILRRYSHFSCRSDRKERVGLQGQKLSIYLAPACAYTGNFQILPKSSKIGHKKWQNTVFNLRLFFKIFFYNIPQECNNRVLWLTPHSKS